MWGISPLNFREGLVWSASNRTHSTEHKHTKSLLYPKINAALKNYREIASCNMSDAPPFKVIQCLQYSTANIKFICFYTLDFATEYSCVQPSSSRNVYISFMFHTLFTIQKKYTRIFCETARNAGLTRHQCTKHVRPIDSQII